MAALRDQWRPSATRPPDTCPPEQSNQGTRGALRYQEGSKECVGPMLLRERASMQHQAGKRDPKISMERRFGTSVGPETEKTEGPSYGEAQFSG